MQICGLGIVSIVRKVFTGLKMWSADCTCEVFNEWYPFEGSSKWVPCIKHFQTNVNRRFLLLFPANLSLMPACVTSFMTFCPSRESLN